MNEKCSHASGPRYCIRIIIVINIYNIVHLQNKKSAMKYCYVPRHQRVILVIVSE